MATMAFSIVGDLVIFVSGREIPADDEWLEYERSIEELAREVRGAGRTAKFIVFADEGGPNPKQRASIVAMLQGISTRTAVVASSILARNLITAFGWLNFSIKGFAPHQLGAAAAYLELSSDQFALVISRAQSLAPQVVGARTVDLAIAEHSKRA